MHNPYERPQYHSSYLNDEVAALDSQPFSPDPVQAHTIFGDHVPVAKPPLIHRLDSPYITDAKNHIILLGGSIFHVCQPT